MTVVNDFRNVVFLGVVCSTWVVIFGSFVEIILAVVRVNATDLDLRVVESVAVVNTVGIFGIVTELRVVRRDDVYVLVGLSIFVVDRVGNGLVDNVGTVETVVREVVLGRRL